MKGLVLGFEPVWDDNRPHQFLNSDSPNSGFLIQEFECLFAEGYHYLIRRFSSRSMYSNVPGFLA